MTGSEVYLLWTPTVGVRLIGAFSSTRWAMSYYMKNRDKFPDGFATTMLYVNAPEKAQIVYGGEED